MSFRCKGSGSTVLCIFNLQNKWRWVVSLLPWSIYHSPSPLPGISSIVHWMGPKQYFNILERMKISVAPARNQVPILHSSTTTTHKNKCTLFQWLEWVGIVFITSLTLHNGRCLIRRQPITFFLLLWLWALTKFFQSWHTQVQTHSYVCSSSFPEGPVLIRTKYTMNYTHTDIQLYVDTYTVYKNWCS
jgi:hypothetical protein